VGTQLVQQWRQRLNGASSLSLTTLAALPGVQQAFGLFSDQGVDAKLQSGSLEAAGDEDIRAEFGVIWTFNGALAGSVSLEVDTEAQAGWMEDMRLEHALQGLGGGRQVMRQVASLCIDLGLDEIRGQASDIGRYAWARCGFDFSNDSERYLAVTGAEEVAAALGRTLDSSDIVHSWDLAELDGDDVPLAVATELFAGDVALKDGFGGSIPYGMALLLGAKGNDWIGCLNLCAGSLSRGQLGI
jgi:GNAT superfamily N-acetyltransferase